MTVILLIVSGFFTGLGFLFRYLNQYADWLNWLGLGAWCLAGIFALWAVVSFFQWLALHGRRKAQLWHRRYVDLTAAQNTQKIILEIPREQKEPQTPYINYLPPKRAGKNNKGKRSNGKR